MIVERLDRLRRQRRRRRELARSKLFDPVWYAQRYPDVANSGLSATQHYIDFGNKEGRSAHPLIDKRWYLARYPDVAQSNIDPLIHYALHGVKEGRWPNAWFDTDYYLAQVSDPDAAAQPLEHYLRHRGASGLDPHPKFSTSNYMREVSEVARGEIDPLQHFLHDPRAEIRGWLAVLTSTFVAGWACRLVGPPLELGIRVNGEFVGKVTPRLKRTDVAAIGLIEKSGYFFSFPTRLVHGDVVEVVDEALAPLLGSPATYRQEPLAPGQDLFKTRASIATMFLNGEGLEIGAFTQPTDLPPGAVARYYDKTSADALLGYYDENCGRPLIKPDYFGDAQTLEGLPEGASFDFVIANHVIEHFENPISFLKALCRVLRPNGIAMIAAPDKRHTFDVRRPLTTFAHLVKDHRNGPSISRKPHYLEWASLVDGLTGHEAQARADHLDREDFSIHFHVWDSTTFVGFLADVISVFALPLNHIFSFADNGEMIAILRRL